MRLYPRVGDGAGAAGGAGGLPRHDGPATVGGRRGSPAVPHAWRACSGMWPARRCGRDQGQGGAAQPPLPVGCRASQSHGRATSTDCAPEVLPPPHSHDLGGGGKHREAYGVGGRRRRLGGQVGYPPGAATAATVATFASATAATRSLAASATTAAAAAVVAMAAGAAVTAAAGAATLTAEGGATLAGRGRSPPRWWFNRTGSPTSPRCRPRAAAPPPVPARPHPSSTAVGRASNRQRRGGTARSNPHNGQRAMHLCLRPSTTVDAT